MVLLGAATKVYGVIGKRVPVALCRGGTSRGLIFHSDALVHYDQPTRERIIRYAMGSPDPDGRQIDGVGGGTSSTSKAAIISPSGYRPDAGLRAAGHAYPGLELLERDRKQIRKMCDVIYRFGQVSIKDDTIDWGSTCGNMVAAVAVRALELNMIRPEVFDHLPTGVIEDPTAPYSIVIRIAAHDTGKIVKARVPVKPGSEKIRRKYKRFEWKQADTGDASISGVPGTGPGILIETPFGDGSVLSTGNERDVVEVDGERIEVSVIDTGLPVIFVAAQSIGLSVEQLSQHPAAIDANRPLMDKLERIRQAASRLTEPLTAVFSPPSPKICVVHAPVDYTSTGGNHVSADEMDLFVRTVSVGQLHRTVPATTLSALAAAQCFPNSVVSSITKARSTTVAASQAAIDDIVRAAGTDADAAKGIRAITVGQPAGLSTASVQSDDAGVPQSVVMLRTARTILDAQMLLPSTGEYLENPDLEPERLANIRKGNIVLPGDPEQEIKKPRKRRR